MFCSFLGSLNNTCPRSGLAPAHEADVWSLAHVQKHQDCCPHQHLHHGKRQTRKQGPQFLNLYCWWGVAFCVYSHTFILFAAMVAKFLASRTSQAYWAIPWMKGVHIISVFSLAHRTFHWTSPSLLIFGDTCEYVLSELLSSSALGLKQSKQGFYVIMGKAKWSFTIITDLHTQQ